MPFHTIPYHIIPYYAMPFHNIPYHTTPYQEWCGIYETMPYHTSYHTPSDAPLLPIEAAKIFLLTFGGDRDLHDWIEMHLAFVRLSEK